MEGPHAGGIGPVNENGADSVRPPPGMSAWAPFDSSQDTNLPRSLAATSFPWVELAPHARHLQRWDPDLDFPLRFIGSPHDGHLLLSTADLPQR